MKKCHCTLTNNTIITHVYVCNIGAGMPSMSRNALFMGSYCGYNSRACFKCDMDSWKWPYALKISPNVKYCSHALRSTGCTSNDLFKIKMDFIIYYLHSISELSKSRKKSFLYTYRRAKWIASSKYWRLNRTRAKFSRTSGLFGDMARARRKQSIAFFVSPLIRQKLPIWLYNCTECGRSRLAFFSRFSNTSMLKFFKFLLCLFLRNWYAACK